MPRRSPFLSMTDLYSVPGSANKVVRSLIGNPEAQELFQAQIAYYRGDLGKVYDDAQYFLNHHTGFYAIVGSGMLLSSCAIWRGDFRLWHEAKRHISTAPCKTDDDREALGLALAAADGVIFEQKSYPAWFEKGCFECLLPDSHPAAKVFYAKWIYLAAYGVASRQYELEGVKGLALMRMVPYTVEPMISQAVIDKTVVPEIHLRLICAVAYHNAGDDTSATEHIDKAIALALPDRFYGILAEYWQMLDTLLETRMRVLAPESVKITKELSKQYASGLARLKGSVRNRYVAPDLTPREREVAKLIAFGFSSRKGHVYQSNHVLRYAQCRYN